MQPKKHLSRPERKVISRVFSGRANPEAKENLKILERPHVAVAIEAILDKWDLTDEKLSRRVRAIVYRKALKSMNLKTGTQSTNQTAIDANALNAIRTIWQLRGKFKGTTDGGGLLKDMPEPLLDKIIESGMSVMKIEKVERAKDGTNSTSD